ncbi:MAG: GNAT family N-acetyltransferase [Lacunisphaera sp.]|nr:GNAT family N-acetyltransferase [Lacunisphaera sp.]
MRPAAGPVLETERLRLRQLGESDAPFILELVNDEAWLRYIGDRGVRNHADARNYILKGPAASYAKFGFGLWLVELRTDATPIGICGLLRRETLPDVDIGFAFMPAFRGQGYALEAGRATLAYGRTNLGLQRIVAITLPANAASIRTLVKLGLRFEKMIRLTADAEELQLFASEL